jgi:hypothetical protein
MKILPLDTSSFSQIRENKNLYVDKTRWIYRLITEGRCYFLSRPRRFGKSLTINTLKELFRGNKELFEGLWIYDKWSFEPHPVIIFDFNNIPRHTPEALIEGLKDTLFEYAEDEDLEIGGEEKEPETLFLRLIKKLYRKYKKSVVILVDEYDKPIIDHLGEGEERFEIAKANRDVLKRFFGVLKGANVVDILKFVFVTGVSAFTKVSIFSEWNNLIEITASPKYADFLGYTEEEIEEYFGDYLDSFCERNGFKTREECMERIRYWYNGYRFSPERDVKVYNPVSIMYCLSEGYFDNWWFKTATPTFLVNLLKERSYLIPDLEHLRVEKEFLNAFDLERLKIEALLFQSGYLTIKEYDGELIRLGYPNQEVKISFSKILLDYLYDAPPNIRDYARELGQALYREDWEEVKEKLNQILAQIPYPLYAKADERFFHTVFYLTLCLLGYDARAETLSPGGRGDMAVTMGGKVFIMEFKAGTSAEEALKQIEEKGYARKFEGKGLKIIKLGISFDVEKREVREIKAGL